MQASDAFTRLALVLEYDGTCYLGFQVQARGPTVQSKLEEAIQRLTGEKARVNCASRTDTGAHALGQVVSFLTRAPYPTETFVRALNHYLPLDIAVRAAYRVPLAWDARRAAVGRHYRYTIWNGPTPSPLWQRFSHWVPQPLHLKPMQEAGTLLLGERDFAPFAGALEKGKGTVRRLNRLEPLRKGDLVTIEVEANAFLPQQIRRMAGALVKVGTSRLSVQGLANLAESRQHGKAGTPLPARGLCLVEVKYPEFPPKVNR